MQIKLYLPFPKDGLKNKVLCSLLHIWSTIWPRVLHTFRFPILEAAVPNNRIDKWVAPLFILKSVMN